MILHLDHEANFTMIDNTLLSELRISAKAKGIVCYLLSKPEGWRVRMKDLEQHFSDGPTALRSGLQEIYKFGYGCIQNKKDEKGKITGRVIHIAEEPQFR